MTTKKAGKTGKPGNVETEVEPKSLGLDPGEEWEKLKRRTNPPYHIGQPATDAIERAILGLAPTDPIPNRIGLDIDGDGIIDGNYTKD